MRNRRDDFRGSMGMGRDEDRERAWSRDEDMGGSRWSGSSGRGGYGDRDRDRDRDQGRSTHGREGGYGGGWGGQREHSGMNMYGRDEEDRQWGRDRDRYDDDFAGRSFSGRDGEHPRSFDRDLDRNREYGSRAFDRSGDYEDRARDFEDRPRNLGARDYETRHFGGGRGGYEQGGYGGSTSYGAFQGSRGIGGYGGGGMMGRQSPYDTFGGRGGRSMEGLRGEGWGQRMGGSDLGFSYGDHEGRDDIDSRGPHYGKGPKGYKRSTDRIREDVCDAIARQGHIDASDVEVKVEENGVVVLTGTVGQRHHKRALEQMVERLHGVEEVRNELRLKRDDQSPMRGRETQTTQTTQTTQNGDQSRQQSSQYPNGKNARA